MEKAAIAQMTALREMAQGKAMSRRRAINQQWEEITAKGGKGETLQPGDRVAAFIAGVKKEAKESAAAWQEKSPVEILDTVLTGLHPRHNTLKLQLQYDSANTLPISHLRHMQMEEGV